MTINARVEVTYTVETQVAVQTVQETHCTDNAQISIVDKNEFRKRFLQTFPRSYDNPERIWHNIMGNHPQDVDGLHPNVHYLTTDSCTKILAHRHLFLNGIDYQHLPAGFFLTKNPMGSGKRDVLHYSNFVAENQEIKNPLSVVLTDKCDQASSSDELDFPGAQGEWYKFLSSKKCSSSHSFCTQQELREAFVTFSNLIESMGLGFYLDRFPFEKDINPIVLLGRWTTVLRNPHLKPENRDFQWKMLLELPLYTGHEAIRSLTDHTNSQHPCGFLIPEMELMQKSYSFDTVKTVPDYNDISDDKSFWRYLAFQPKCNSIAFYQKAIKTIRDMDIDGYQFNQVLKLLAGSTTNTNHRAHSPGEEEAELQAWIKVCNLIDTVETRSSATQLLAKDEPGALKRDFLHHICRLKQQPNIAFLDSITKHITDEIDSVGLLGGLIAHWSDKNPLANLEQLSDKLDRLITNYKSDIYHGSRFYFSDGQWSMLGIKTYIELQDTLVKSQNQELADLLVPHVSTFSIQTSKDIDSLMEDFNKLPDGSDNDVIGNLEFYLRYFHDAKKQLGIGNLIKLIDIATTAETNKIELLDMLSSNFLEFFPDDYFACKKQELEDSLYGLNPEQIALLNSYSFSPTDRKFIIQIESKVVKNQPHISNDELNGLNNSFTSLQETLMPDEFEAFLERLASIREYITDSATLLETLQLSLKQKSLVAFNTIFFRHKITPCNEGAPLLSKINGYIRCANYVPERNWEIEPLALQEVMATLFLQASQHDMDTSGYENEIFKCIDSLYELMLAHPQAQEYLVQSINNMPIVTDVSYLDGNLKALMASICHLNILFPSDDLNQSTENMSIFYSFLSHFHRNPEGLLELFKSLGSNLDESQERFFLVLASRILDSNYSIDGMQELIKMCARDKKNYDLLNEYCNNPPYPRIENLIDWLRKGTFAEQYLEFSLTPFGDRHLEYAFNSTHYTVQREKFEGVGDSLFSDEVGEDFKKLLSENCLKPISDLQSELENFRRKSELSASETRQLLCLCVEFLARTTYQTSAAGSDDICSQELNTTQVMTLYAMLMQENPKVINQIDTGEGKSRIMMTLAAFKAVLGKTVDFITSDMQLAERDYFKYKQFFTALDVPSSLISLKTPKQLYRKQGGINFSDNAQLLLLRNRSDIERGLSRFDYFDENEENLCLLVDEVDRFMHDKSLDSCNYASKSRELVGFLWVYPLLVQFMQQQLDSLSVDETLPEDESLLDPFIKFVRLHDTNLTHQASLASFKDSKPKQLEIWLKSARTALNMENKVNYVVTEENDSKFYVVRDPDGFMRHTRKVLVLENGGRPIESNSFSDGVQQCLCAIESKKAGREVFIILPETATERSSYSTTFMNKYSNLYGVSGSTRSHAPRSNPLINRQQYHYLTTPREKALIRDDKNVWAAKDKSQQIDFIKHEILATMKENKSFLLICKNDKQSGRIKKALFGDEQLQRAVSQWKYVDSLTEPEEEKKAIAQAGIPKHVTISTSGMFSRGVDIDAENMYVATSFVPTIEDEIQIKGRAARFGRPGSYRMIPNISDKENPLEGVTYNIANSVDSVQKKMAMSAAFQEEVTSVYAQFLEDVTQVFLEEYDSTTEAALQLTMLDNWQKFLGDMQKNWEIEKNKLLPLFETEDEKTFLEFFQAFTDKWSSKIPVQNQESKNGIFNKDQARPVFESLIAQKGFFNPERKPLKAQAYYDCADDGQARIYSNLFSQTRATLCGKRPLFANTRAWLQGRGVLFADLRATLQGERPLFANLRATIARLIRAIVEWWKNRRTNSIDTNATSFDSKRHDPSTDEGCQAAAVGAVASPTS